MNVITKEKIIEAAKKLVEAGKNPTQVSVREALGGGSFATIGPVLKDWKESQKEDHSLAEIVVPEAITERFAQLHAQLQGAVWEAALGEAESRLTAEREALKAAQEAAAAEVAEQQDSVAMLEAEAMEAQQRIEQLEAEAMEAQQRKEQLKAAAHAAASKITELTVQVSSLAERAERAETLHQKVTEQSRVDLSELKAEHKAEFETVKQEAAQAAQQAAVSEAKLDAEQATTKDLRCRLEAAEKRGNEEQKTIEAMKVEHAQALENLNIELRQALEAKAKTEREGDTQKHQIEALAREKNDLAAKVVELERTNAELTDKDK